MNNRYNIILVEEEKDFPVPYEEFTRSRVALQFILAYERSVMIDVDILKKSIQNLSNVIIEVAPDDVLPCGSTRAALIDLVLKTHMGGSLDEIDDLDILRSGEYLLISSCEEDLLETFKSHTYEIDGATYNGKIIGDFEYLFLLEHKVKREIPLPFVDEEISKAFPQFRLLVDGAPDEYLNGGEPFRLPYRYANIKDLPPEIFKNGTISVK